MARAVPAHNGYAGGVDGADTVRALEEALERLDVVVRSEPLPEEARISGGFCVVRGKPTVFVAPDAPETERIAVLVDALRRLPTTEIWLPPAVRALLEDAG